jgi:hypothetical protein
MDGSKRILKENCLVVQNFDYQCTFKRNEKGRVFGAMESVILSFKVRVNDPRHAMMFLMELASNNVSCFSFLFNAIYGPNERLKEYEDGMVVKGYIVAVIARGIFASLAGYIFWMEYMPENFPQALKSVYPICYNFMYLLVEAVITVIVISIPVVKNALERVRRMAVE